MTLRAARYDDTIQKLRSDPIIQKMAQEVILDFGTHNLDQFFAYTTFEESDGSRAPKYPMMVSALDTYKKRGGEIETHIGGPAEAIIEILSEQR